MSHAVPDHAAPETEQFLADLVDELTRRVQAGEVIDVEQVAGEHPGRADAIRRLLPTLELLGELGFAADGGAAAGGRAGAALGDARRLPHPPRGGPGRHGGRVRGRADLAGPPGGPQGAAVRRRRSTPASSSGSGPRPRRRPQLHHTNIVPVYAVGCERGVHYYAMQFIEGQTLAAVDRRASRQLVRAAKPAPVADLGPRTSAGRAGRHRGRRPGRTGPPPGDQADRLVPAGILRRAVAAARAGPADVPVTPGRSAATIRAAAPSSARRPSWASRPPRRSSTPIGLGDPPPRHQAGQPAARRARQPLGHRLRPGPAPERYRPDADRRPAGDARAT